MQIADAVVRLRPLTLVDEGDDVLVGDPESGNYVAIPAVGAVVIRALQRGDTVASAAAEAERAVGEPVDVAAFVDALRELGFVADDSAQGPSRTAVVQQRRWAGGPAPERVRPLFSRVAWLIYAGAFVFCVACFVARPDLWPRGRDVFVVDDYDLSLFIMMPLSALLASLHETWHWLAARAEGVTARFGLDRRLFFPVVETDLSQLWSLPRRRRYGPQLAGMALDAVLLAVFLGVELAYDAPRTVRCLVFLQVTQFLWQSMIFMRTDVYGVFVTATGCRNLWEVKSLLLRRAFRRLSPVEEGRLAEADPRDVRIGGWFRWVYLAGVLVAVGYFVLFFLPGVSAVLRWAGRELTMGPWHGGFWRALAAVVLICWSPLMAGVLTVVAAIRRDR
ncbi:hypothetical protein [Actinoallomurus sp. CA-150999]|uniref:hypothetical protein n=1 Tax=Actinoallomurus sp. CA-150999 TaxID=3239887 RepID=UPI003D8E8842